MKQKIVLLFTACWLLFPLSNYLQSPRVKFADDPSNVDEIPEDSTSGLDDELPEIPAPTPSTFFKLKKSELSNDDLQTALREFTKSLDRLRSALQPSGILSSLSSTIEPITSYMAETVKEYTKPSSISEIRASVDFEKDFPRADEILTVIQNYNEQKKRLQANESDLIALQSTTFTSLSDLFNNGFTDLLDKITKAKNHLMIQRHHTALPEEQGILETAVSSETLLIMGIKEYSQRADSLKFPLGELVKKELKDKEASAKELVKEIEVRITAIRLIKSGLKKYDEFKRFYQDALMQFEGEKLANRDDQPNAAILVDKAFASFDAAALDINNAKKIATTAQFKDYLHKIEDIHEQGKIDFKNLLNLHNQIKRPWRIVGYAKDAILLYPHAYLFLGSVYLKSLGFAINKLGEVVSYHPAVFVARKVIAKEEARDALSGGAYPSRIKRFGRAAKSAAGTAAGSLGASAVRGAYYWATDQQASSYLNEEDEISKIDTNLSPILESIAKQSTASQLLADLDSNYRNIQLTFNNAESNQKRVDAAENILRAMRTAVQNINYTSGLNMNERKTLTSYVTKITNLGMYGKEKAGWVKSWGMNDDNLIEESKELLAAITAAPARNTPETASDVIQFLNSLNSSQPYTQDTVKQLLQIIFDLAQNIKANIEPGTDSSWRAVTADAKTLGNAIAKLKSIQSTSAEDVSNIENGGNKIFLSIANYDTNARQLAASNPQDMATRNQLYGQTKIDVQAACDEITEKVKKALQNL